MIPFWRRQRVFIDRLQFKLMAINLVYFSMFSLIFATVIFGPHVYTLYDAGASVEAQQLAADSMLLLHSTIWPPLVVVALIFLYHLMIYSHRIAGPLYRFRSVFEAVRDGNLRARAVIRTRDFLHRESAILNSMIEATEHRVEDVADAVHAVHQAVRDIKSGAHGNSCYLSLGVIEGLETRVEAAQNSLAGFRHASSDRSDVPPVTAERDPETDSQPTAQV